jgi:hypothetical protein
MSEINPPTECRVTRAKNANQHLGLLAPKKKRRTKEEIERDKALLQEKKEANAREKPASVTRVAQLEDRMAVEDSGAESAHPCRNGVLIHLGRWERH